MHPLRRAVNPLLATVRGVLGSVLLHLFLDALFVAGEAFPDPALGSAAKMGAMLSLFAFVPAALVMKLGRRAAP